MAVTPWGRVMQGLAGAAAVTAALGFAAAAGAAEDADVISDGQRREIDVIIRDYIMKNPDVIIESVRRHQQEQAEQAEIQARAELVSARSELENDPTSPVVGNIKGDVTVVEFFDYQCGYCKKVFPDLRELIEADGNIRYVLKEYPVLGPDSVTAARASLAVWAEYPDRYFDFHAALMSSRGALSESRVLGIAEELGINPNQLRAAMQKPAIEAKMEKVRTLADRLAVRGTPAFVIGGELVPGAVSLDQLKALVARARQG